MGTITEWTYPGPLVVPTKGAPGTDMADLQNASYYGAPDGSDTRVSQIHAVRDLAIDNRSWIFAGPFIGQTITVGKSGAVQYNSIQDAIDYAVTQGPAADNRILILVYPGEYNELITVPAWVSVKGVGEPQDVLIWNNTGTVCTCTAGFSGLTRFPTQVANLTIQSTPTAPGAKLLFANQGGELLAERVDLRYYPTGTYGTAIDVDVGSIRFRGIRGWYVQTGAGGGDHKFIDTNQLAGVIGLGAEIVMTIESDDDVYGYDSQAVVNDAADIVSTTLDITVSHASYSSQCVGIRHAGPAANIHFNSGRLTIKATGGSVTGDGTGIYLGHAAAQISSIGSKVEVSGFANDWHANGTAGTLKSHFDLISAANGVNTSTLTYRYATTGSAGNFTVFGSVFLDNDGGECIILPTAIGTKATTHYRFNVGGGGAATGAPDNEGGTFTIAFEDIGSQLGTAVNKFIVDLGKPDPLALDTFNEYVIQCDNYQATYGFVSRFANFNTTKGFGWALEVLDAHPGEPRGRQLFFDNNVTYSDVNRSVDFRIAGDNKLTVENNSTVIAHYRFQTPRATITSIDNGVGFGPIGIPAVIANGYLNFLNLGWYDLLEFRGLSANLPLAVDAYPNGSATDAFFSVHNGSTLGQNAWCSLEIMGSAAALIVRDFAQTTNVTELKIGSGGNDFPSFDVTCSTLTDINFIFAGVTECTIQQNALIFNNGATDTRLDWGTNGELGLQVATNDIVRLTASQIQCIQDLVISDAQNIVLNTSTGTQIGTASGQKLGFYGATPVVQPAAYTPTNVTTDRSYDANSTTIDELADVLGTLIADLQSLGLVQ